MEIHLQANIDIIATPAELKELAENPPAPQKERDEFYPLVNSILNAIMADITKPNPQAPIPPPDTWKYKCKDCGAGFNQVHNCAEHL